MEASAEQSDSARRQRSRKLLPDAIAADPRRPRPLPSAHLLLLLLVLRAAWLASYAQFGRGLRLRGASDRCRVLNAASLIGTARGGGAGRRRRCGHGWVVEKLERCCSNGRAVSLWEEEEYGRAGGCGSAAGRGAGVLGGEWRLQ